MWEGVSQASEKSVFMRVTGPFIAIASALLSLAERVASVGEAIIKGLANIFGSPFPNKCNALKGLEQIFIELPWHALSLVIFPVEIGIRALITSVCMLVIPKGYSKNRKIFYQERLEKLERKAEESV